MNYQRKNKHGFYEPAAKGTFKLDSDNSSLWIQLMQKCKNSLKRFKIYTRSNDIEIKKCSRPGELCDIDIYFTIIIIKNVFTFEHYLTKSIPKSSKKQNIYIFSQQ